jgi:hypothetical protein
LPYQKSLSGIRIFFDGVIDAEFFLSSGYSLDQSQGLQFLGSRLGQLAYIPSAFIGLC